MTIEQIDVRQVKVAREAQQKLQKMEEKKDTKMKIKIQKTRPLNNGGPPPAPRQPEFQCSEYKTTPSILLVEGVSRGIPNVLPADTERLRRRLLSSPDIAYLLDRKFGNVDVENDNLKLILTLLFHIGNEVVQTITETLKTAEVVSNQKPPPPTSSKPSPPKATPSDAFSDHSPIELPSQ